MPELRLATPEDSDAVNDLVKRAFEDYVPRIGLRPGPMDTDYGPLIEAGSVQLAGEPIAGAVALRSETDALWVELVVVDPEHQGGGLGSALMSFAEAEAVRLGREEVRLFTHGLMSENRAFLCEARLRGVRPGFQ